MAVYHLCCKMIGRSSGKGAPGSAAYRACQKIHDQRIDRTFDYSRKMGLAHSEILIPENAPEWMKNREKLWNEVERVEKRKDSQLAREIEIALPRELSLTLQVNLVRDFAKENFVDEGMVADINIHDTGENPHAHIMLTTRHIDEEGFGKKNTAWNKKEMLLKWREAWAQTQNLHLAKNGMDISVDHRSYVDRGIDLEPQNKLGPILHFDNPENTEKMKEFRRIARENGEQVIKDPTIAINHLTYHKAVFGRDDIFRFAHTYSDDQKQFNQVVNVIENSLELVRVGVDEKNHDLFTSKEMLKTEQETMKTARDMSKGHSFPVNDRVIEQALDQRTMKEEQERAFRHIVEGPDIASVVGYAGTGKTYMLGAVHEAYDAEGYTIKGMALSGVAAENLKESGIESDTIHKHLWEWDHGRNLPNEKTVLVVDEAGMVGTRQAHKIMSYARDKGAKVVFVGDPQQLQPIEAGGVFRGIIQEIGHAEMTEVVRQKEAWQQEASKNFGGSREQIVSALERYKSKGHVKTSTRMETSKFRLVSDWKKGVETKSQIMLAYTNKDVSDLNREAREVMRASERLGKKSIEFETEKGIRSFSVGDRLIFLSKDRGLKVENGSVGIVNAMSKEGIEVTLEKGHQVVFDPRKYNTFDHGYATTIHKSQGATYDKVYVLGSYHFDKHMTNVAMTRHRESVDLYISKEKGSGFRDFNHFTHTASRERPKNLIRDFTESRGIALHPEMIERYIPREKDKKERDKAFKEFEKRREMKLEMNADKKALERVKEVLKIDAELMPEKHYSPNNLFEGTFKATIDARKKSYYIVYDIKEKNLKLIDKTKGPRYEFGEVEERLIYDGKKIERKETFQHEKELELRRERSFSRGRGLSM